MNPDNPTTDQIAAEAADIIRGGSTKWWVHSPYLEAVIKAAIEKAYEQGHYDGASNEMDIENKSRAAHASEIDPVSGYRYDQEIPKPICEMKQIEPSQHPTPATKYTVEFVDRGGAGIEIDEVLETPAAASEQEWTAEYVRNLMLKSQLVDQPDSAIVIADAHNATLAAEREKVQTLVELLGQVLQETVNTPVYPNAPCLNKETRDDIKAALAKLKEEK